MQLHHDRQRHYHLHHHHRFALSFTAKKIRKQKTPPPDIQTDKKSVRQTDNAHVIVLRKNKNTRNVRVQTPQTETDVKK